MLAQLMVLIYLCAIILKSTHFTSPYSDSRLQKAPIPFVPGQRGGECAGKRRRMLACVSEWGAAVCDDLCGSTCEREIAREEVEDACASEREQASESKREKARESERE
jgi:hypothetical protein